MIIDPKDKSEPEHYRLSPSSSKRWLECPGSARSDLPFSTNAKAEAGDVAHELADQFLKYKGHKDKLILEDDVYRLTVDLVGHDTANEIARAVTKYIDCVEEHIIQGCQIYFEVKIAHDVIPEYGGTLDTIIYNPGAEYELVIIDLKTGTYKVPAKKNTQLMSYAVLGRQHFPTENPVKAIIVQDRVYKKPQVAYFDKMSVDAFEERVRIASEKTFRVAGSHCYFCPLKKTCEEYAAKFGSSQ